MPISSASGGSSRRSHAPGPTKVVISGDTITQCLLGMDETPSPLPINLSYSFGNSCMIGSGARRSEEHTSELQSLMRISYAVFCLKKKKQNDRQIITNHYVKTNPVNKPHKDENTYKQ